MDKLLNKDQEDTISALEYDAPFDHLTHDAAHRPDIHWQNTIKY